MENEKRSLFGGISRVIFQHATSAISTLRNWMSRETQENDDGDAIVIENNIALKSILKKKKKRPKERSPKVQGTIGEMLQLMKLQTKQREREDGCIRQGPMPIEDIPVSERGPSKLTHATLNPIEMTGNSDFDEENPTNRGMLTYFARIGQTSAQNERVDLVFLKSLLRAGANINIGDKYGQTILHAVARDWHIDVARYVIDNGSDVNARDRFGRTPLHVAAAVNYPEMIEFLLNNGADLHGQTEGELQTPIHYAAKFNAVASLKCLLKFGAKVSDRDYNDRTPLFLAAEQGQRDATKFLLNLGVAAAVYDDQGNSAVSLMIEKMPDLAVQALDQFIVEDKPNRKIYFYLCSLEYAVSCKFGQTPARSALETLAYSKDKDLAQHGVINKLIETKWHMIAKRTALLDIAVNFFYACIGTVLATTLDRKRIYTPLSQKGWRIGFEALFVIMTLFFIIRWPEERRYLKKEIHRIEDMSCSYTEAWTYYELISFLAMTAIVVSQFTCIKMPNKYSDNALVFSYSINMFLIWLRLLRPCKTIQALSGLIVMLGEIAKGSIRYIYIFMEFFVPLVTAFHIMFGGSVHVQKMVAKIGNSDDVLSFSSLDRMTFVLEWVTVGGPFTTKPLEAVDIKLANLMVSIFYALMKIIAANLFISLLSHLFGRTYNTARATALLQSADYILQVEKNLSWKNSKKSRKRMKQECNPLETYDIQLTRMKSQSHELEEAANSVSERSEKLEKAFTTLGNKINEDHSKELLNSAEIVMKAIEDIDTMQEHIEETFNTRIEQIVQNQANIRALLSKPAIAEFILKNNSRHKDKDSVRRKSSSSSE
eukprot:gene2479-18141_t